LDGELYNDRGKEMNRLPSLVKFIGFKINDCGHLEPEYEDEFSVDELESMIYSNRLYEDEKRILERIIANGRLMEMLPIIGLIGVANVIIETIGVRR
jgi:hypothetical protein